MHGARDMHSLSHQQSMFGPMATALPPIRANVQLPPMDSAIPPQYRRQEIPSMQQHHHRQHQQQQLEQQQSRKEEKATGGVAAHLDYEMDRMSDFVAEMTQGMYELYNTKITLADIDFARSISPGTSVPPQFRKYVYQILSSTRLPSSTILLGLFYMSSRMRILSAQRVFQSGSGQIYRMLTVGLLLGSKFLDDNTFQNKSWAEVSNIPVAELNKMELEWLFGFDWKIHERIYDQQDGFASWRRHWDNWSAKANVRAQESSRQTLAPIDTNVVRHHQSVPSRSCPPKGPSRRSTNAAPTSRTPGSTLLPPSTPRHRLLTVAPTPPTTTQSDPGASQTRHHRTRRAPGLLRHGTLLSPHLARSPRPTTTLRRMACHSLRVSGLVTARPVAACTVPSIWSITCATVLSPRCSPLLQANHSMLSHCLCVIYYLLHPC